MRLVKTLTAAALTLSVLGPVASPAFAQNERVLTIFGEDKCPADTICVRAPERDRYRIPKYLREPSKSPESVSWSQRSRTALDAGKSGIGSCSASGAGGWTGCWQKEMEKARAEAKAEAAQGRKIP